MKDKMKKTGYLCLLFSVLVALAMLFKLAESTPGMEIMKYWGVTGIGLLTVNAGKRLGGHYVDSNK